jgi:hypothetical protein
MEHLEKEVLALHHNGIRAPEIARTLNVTYHCVWQVLNRNNISSHQNNEHALEKKGGWWENKPNDSKILKEFPHAPKLIRTYYVKCQNCQTPQGVNDIIIAFKKMSRPYCSQCMYDFKWQYKEYPRRTKETLDFPTDAQKGVADIYTRVSTPYQARPGGDGLRRQEESGIEYCRDNKIRVRHIIQDIYSAYRTDNFVTANLGYKVNQWKKFKGIEVNRKTPFRPEEPPAYLIIEDMDRFTRQPPLIGLCHLMTLRNLGTKLVVYKSAWGGDESEVKIY